MKYYALYSVADGVVRMATSIPDGLEPDVPSGMDKVLLGNELPSGPHRVVGGLVQAYTIVPTLDSLKEAKWVAIKAKRELSVAQPKTTSVGVFDADLTSQNNLNKVIALLQIGVARGYHDSANYTLATNQRVAFTTAQLQTAALEMGAQVQGIYDQADALRTAIEAATTAAAVEAVTWPP